MRPTERALPCIRAIKPYQPGQLVSELARQLNISADDIIKLASNENPLGMSARAKAALLSASLEAHRYPDQFELSAALADKLSVRAEEIVLGNGSNDVLELTARTFLGPGRSAIMSRHAFAVYSLVTQAVGANCLFAAPTVNFGHDLAAMRALLDAETSLIWIANPNNPTGTWLTPDELLGFMQSIPPDVIVVIDEAYNEYLPAPPQGKDDTVRWLDDFPNLIITRTFSKIYGLAGLRVGYAVTTQAMADLLHRVRQPFNVNGLALAAATAALADGDFVAHSRELNQAGLAQLEAGIGKLGLRTLPAHANFITMHAGDDSPQAADKLFASLQHEGIITRPLTSYQMPAWLRVTVGNEFEIERLLSVLPKALATAGLIHQ